MGDVTLLLLSQGGTLAGLAIGYARGRRRPAAPRPLKAECTCDHPLSSHDPETNRCHEVVDWTVHKGRRVNEVCACRQYVGPRPIDQVFQPRTLPPA